MVWLLMSMVFLAAGLTKLRMSGLEWVLSNNLANTIMQHHYGHLSAPPSRIGLWVAQHKLLCRFIAGMTIAVEVGFPLAMFSRAARWLLLPAMFFTQIGIYFLMGVPFTEFMFVYLFWVPWDRVGNMLARVVPSAKREAKYVMLYDGGCGICRSVASVITRLDLMHRVEPLDVLNAWATVA